MRASASKGVAEAVDAVDVAAPIAEVPLPPVAPPPAVVVVPEPSPVPVKRVPTEALAAKYPQKAVEISLGAVVWGPVVETRVPVKVPGGWDTQVVSRHQKYRVSDGTVLVLDADE